MRLRERLAYLPLSLLLALSLLGSAYWPPTQLARIEREFPPFLGLKAGLRWGLWAQTQLPPLQPTRPSLAWLAQTLGGRKIERHPIVLFRPPVAQSAFRRQGLRVYFQKRFGWADAWQIPFQPRTIILHSTEGENEAHAFAIFNRNTEQQYLGGVWTHFSVGPEGTIYQYGPLNRISKGQAGLDDLAVGIEMVGTASLWNQAGVQTRTGSIMARWQDQDQAQIRAVEDLVQTLRTQFGIPLNHIYSHEDLGHIRDRRGLFPDYRWLRQRIRDRVYLSLEPTLNADFKPEHWYSFLEPYDRYDPGHDVMALIYRHLRQTS